MNAFPSSFSLVVDLPPFERPVCGQYKKTLQHVAHLQCILSGDYRREADDTYSKQPCDGPSALGLFKLTWPHDWFNKVIPLIARSTQVAKGEPIRLRQHAEPLSFHLVSLTNDHDHAWLEVSVHEQHGKPTHQFRLHANQPIPV